MSKKMWKTTILIVVSLVCSMGCGYILCYVFPSDDEPILRGMTIAFFIPFIAVVSYHLFED